MTCHTPNPKCHCDLCFAADLEAVARWFEEQREARKVEQHNAQVLQDNRAKDEWRDTADFRGRNSDLESDPHATDLALAVAEEMRTRP